MTKGSRLLQDAGITAPELARGLGWFSLALGTIELMLPRTITGFLGMRGREGLVRLYGVREVGTGLAILGSSDPAPWMWGRWRGTRWTWQRWRQSWLGGSRATSRSRC